ncbi:MAG: amidohydrolase family protein [Verrucomicrobiota bacterium]
MRIIDAHVHLYPAEVNADPAGWAAAQSEAHWARLCTRRRRDGHPVQGFPAVDGLLRAMDAAEVERSILLGWYWEKPATCGWQNRFFADCVRAHPDRLAAFATVHPAAGREATLAEVRRAHGDGLIGLGELSPHSQHVPPDDPGWHDVLTLAAELRLPVNLHVTEPEARPFPGRVDTPLEDFVRLAQAHPTVTFILAHWGGGLDITPLPNVLVDTAAAPLIYGDKVWSRLGRDVPPERVLFGSDFPLDLYPRSQPGAGVKPFIAEAAANVADSLARTALFSGNARRLFGWA